MLERIVAGGQTGADQAGLRAAKAVGLATGGYAPLGWLTEDGPAPWLGTEFGLVQCTRSGYPARTRANVRDADGTIIFEAVESVGSTLTDEECHRQNKPMRVVLLGFRSGWIVRSALSHTPASIAEWIVENRIKTLNVAGNRESKAPGIGAFVERFMLAVFAELGIGVGAAKAEG